MVYAALRENGRGFEKGDLSGNWVASPSFFQKIDGDILSLEEQDMGPLFAAGYMFLPFLYEDCLPGIEGVLSIVDLDVEQSVHHVYEFITIMVVQFVTSLEPGQTHIMVVHQGDGHLEEFLREFLFQFFDSYEFWDWITSK